MNWLVPNTIYVTLGGSQAYGLNNELSDTDVKGIVIPPKEVENNLFHRFEQSRNDVSLEESLAHLKNPKNPKFESEVYSLKKFMVLAANVNPNIIEMLWTDPSDQFVFKKPMDILMENRNLFLSSKAKFTFSGYAFAQAAKIERHRKWIVQGELTKPNREDSGLPLVTPKGVDEVFGYIKSRVEEWNLNQFTIDEQQRADLKETIWELVYTLSDKAVSWDNWPDAYAQGVIHQLQHDLSLKDEVVNLINAERAYFKAVNNYNSWLRWKAERNPARRELEVKSGYDTKHGSHLVRLLRMGYEILTEHKIVVKRPDREEILYIKNGGWTYEKLIEYAKEFQIKLEKAYKTTTLPKSVNYETINSLYHHLYENYHLRK